MGLFFLGFVFAVLRKLESNLNNETGEVKRKCLTRIQLGTY